MGKEFSSIRFKALSLLALIFAVMLSLTAYLALSHRAEDLDEARDLVKAVAERVAAEQNDVIAYTQQFMRLMLEAREVSQFMVTPLCQDMLAQRLKQEPRLAGISIALPNGDLVCNSTPSATLINISDRPYFQKALRTAEPVTGAALRGRASGRWSIPFYQAIRDDAGQVKGVYSVYLDLSWVGNALAKGAYPEGARVGLIDIKGTILARYPDPEAWIGMNASDSRFFKTLVAQGGSGNMEEVGLDGERRIYGLARFADTDAGPIFLWVGVSKNSVMANVNREFAWSASLSLGLLILAFAFAWLGLERSLLRPALAISDAARRVGAGDLDARTGLAHADDELGQLARSFDEMAESIKANSQLGRVNRALRVLSAGNRTLIHAADEHHLLEEMCRAMVAAGGYRMAWVGYAEHDQQKSVRPVASCGVDANFFENLNLTWGDAESGQGPSGSAIRLDSPVAVHNALTDPAYAAWREAAVRHRYASSVALPLRIDGVVAGVLNIYAEEPDAFGDEEIALLSEAAADLSYGIDALRTRADRNRIAHEHQHHAEILRQSLEASIQAIADTIDRRDAYTAGHQRRVGELAVAIAREMELSEEQCHGIRLAAMVHDLGKISVPAEILSKPGKLTSIEYQLVQAHAQTGYDILKSVAFPWPIAAIVLQHHEKLDGSGYPQGLKDGAILLEARIMTVADIVEAMASHRPYRPALGVEAALQEIERGSGTLYDPAVANACVKLFRERQFAFAS